VADCLKEAAAVRSKILLSGKDFVKWRALGVTEDQVCVIEPEIEWKSRGEEWLRVVWQEESCS
jgi:hypothetical protein